MKKLCPGSWVYGTFSTWIGEPEKNRAWDLLIEAKQTYDDVLMENGLDETSRLKASRQLAICEGSDWFWWFGDYNPSESVRDFDYLFRHQLDQLYRILGRPIPENLSIPVSTGGDYAESAGTMRRSHT
jgi:alpha-amylase/alpha-mannosidase (GH57 family)